MDIGSLERAIESGAVTFKEQRLVALGIAIALRGGECIANHVRDALEAGATRAELADAVKVALTVGDGSAAVYEHRLYQALEALDAGDERRACAGACGRPATPPAAPAAARR